jgi:hypothetical protein
MNINIKRKEIRVCKYSLTPPLFIYVPVSNKEIGRGLLIFFIGICNCSDIVFPHFVAMNYQ